MNPFPALATASSLIVWTTLSALAQGTTGVPGAPGATTTIDGKQLPPPDPNFGGVINQKASDSKPWWAPRVVPPKGAPNVLLIMTDDVGFGAPGTFGGVIPTPALDRIANSGLRYTNFHSTSLCSPTRAAIDHGPQSSRRRLRCRRRSRDRLSGLRLGHPQGERHHRRDSKRATATRPRGSARTTTRRSIRRPRPDRSINGRTAWALNISTASSAATRASGSRTCIATRRRSTRSRASRAGT